MAGDVYEQPLAAAEVVADRAEREALASPRARGGVVDALVSRPLGSALGEQTARGLDQRLRRGGLRAALGELRGVGAAGRV